MADNYYSTNVDGTAEDFAEKFILENARERDYVSIGDFMESEGLEWAAEHMTDWDKLCERIYHKVGTAEMDIYWSKGR